MDRIYRATRKKISYSRRRFFITTAIMIALSVFSIWNTYRSVMENAKIMGEELIKSYAADEERNISVYKTIVQTGLTYVDNVCSDEYTEKEKEELVNRFFEQAKTASKNDNIKCFAVFDGKMVSSDKGKNVKEYQEIIDEWYNNIGYMPDGNVTFSKLYKDNVINENVVSICSVSPRTGNVFVVDLEESTFEKMHSDINLLKDSSYYLCDNTGKILYEKTPFNVSKDELSPHIALLCEKINNGEITNTKNNIKGFGGKEREVYYSRVSNDWLCIFTVPNATFLKGICQSASQYIVIILLFFIIMFALWRKGEKTNTDMKNVVNTITAICNSFYAIYRVNLREEKYEMLKGSAEVKKTIPKGGNYKDMVLAISNMLDEETAADFRKSFAVDKIKEVIKNKVSNYGGDFKRMIDGKYKWVNVNIIFDKFMPKDEVIIAFREIDKEKSNRLQHIKLMEEALAAADANEKSQKQFFANMSHDMRTPLNIILGMNELMAKDDCTAEKRRDYSRKIDKTGRNLLALINDILDVSRLEQGEVHFEKKAFDICDEFEECIQPFKEEAEAEGKKFTVESEVFTKLVVGDALRLNQILNNLLSNASKFTKKGDTISVSLKQAGRESKNYIFIVEDTGIGMSSEFLPKLFTPYERENRFGAGAAVGNGLGMAIVKNLVSQKGGQITVESKLSEGTKFVVTLPFAPEEKKTEKELKSGNMGCLSGLHILIVEDNELNRELICELISDLGGIVTEACDGADGFEKFEKSKENEFDLILMDMQMPKMDGCEAAKRIRALDRADAKKVMIIAITANAFSEDVARTLQAGMDAHLVKPIDMGLLCNTVAELLKKR